MTSESTLPFRILFEDQNVLVISKPAGLLSQGDSSGEASLVDVLRTYFGRHYVGLVHRLDRNTTGLMVIAKRSKAAERLTEQLQKGDLIRHYHALLWGELKVGEVLRWKHHLLKNESTNEVRVVGEKTPGAKLAVLTVFPIQSIISPASGKNLSLARFELETGRSHQIRVQSKASGHPLIGDTKYGNDKSVTEFARPALHSCHLEFLHPISKERMSFDERYSADMIASFPHLLDH